MLDIKASHQVLERSLSFAVTHSRKFKSNFTCLHLTGSQIYHSTYFQLHYGNKYHVFSAQRALCSWSWDQNLSYSVCVNKENTQICCHVALVQAEQTGTGPPKTVGAAWKAQELVCSSGGATGLHLWHDQFCSLHRALIDEALFVLILISFFIFIMAETALGKRRPWWTN